ncbi:MAG: phosphoglycolate phosphatase [Magnetospirillum sp. WYHS-4]
MGRFKAVVFDLDGTLIDSAPDLLTAANKLLAEEGRPAIGVDHIKLMVGDGVPKLVERAFTATGGLAEGDLPRLAARFLDFYEGHAADETRPYPGVEAALEGLKTGGFKLAVCTNKPHAATLEILEALGLAPYFDVVVGGDSLPGIKKPDPRHVLACVEALGADATDALLVGDSQVDVQAGRAAGLPVIAAAHGYARMPPEQLGADLVLEDFARLPEVVAGLVGDVSMSARPESED